MKSYTYQTALKSFFILSTYLLLNVESAYSNTIYVATGATGSGSVLSPAGLQAALDIARTNGLDDTLLLQTGNYDASAGTFTYDTTENDNHSVVLSGGWNIFYNSQIMDNSLTTLDGGGVNQVFYLAANKPGLNFNFSFSNITFQNGYTTNKAGAGLLAYIGATANNDVGNLNFYINQCNFNHNKATTSMSGGAIYTNCYFEITGSQFYSDSAYNGGAIFSVTKPDLNQTMSPLIDHCYFEDNYNYGNQGSTIWHNVTLRFKNSTIKGRSDGVSSSGNGSSIWGNAGSFTIAHNSLFTGIRIKYWGCGIQSFDGGMEIVNCVFEDNQVLFNGFAAVTYFHNNGTVDRKIKITNCTFIRNHSWVDEAGAIHMRLNGNDSCIVTNCIFWDNGSNPIEKENSTSYAGFSYSLIQGGYVGFGFVDAGYNLISSNPMFTSSNDYHLLAGSPCIDAGSNFAPALLPYDKEGTNRILGIFTDMGVYEFNQSPNSINLSANSIIENVPAGSFVALMAAVDPDAGDTHTFELAVGDGINDADNQSFFINDDSLFILVSPNFEQQNQYFIFLRTRDSGGKDTTAAYTMYVLNLNEAPVVVIPLIDQVAMGGTMFTYTFDANTFVDYDFGDVIALNASINGAALPAWLNFNSFTRTFSGIPPAKDTLEIVITANDIGLLFTTDTFMLYISQFTGIANLTANNFTVYPNPVYGNSLTIRSGNLTTPQRVNIYSLEGKMLLQYELNKPTYTIDISTLQAGEYLLVINVDGNQSFTKFAVIK